MLKLQSILRQTTGAEIAEAALVLPILFLVLLSILWFGRAYNIYATINRAALEGARLAATDTCATCGNLDLSGTANLVANNVAQALQASKLDPSQVTSTPPQVCACDDLTCATPLSCAPISSGPQICVQFSAQLASTRNSPGGCGVVVSFQYPYQFYVPFTSLNLQTLNLNAQVQAMGEN